MEGGVTRDTDADGIEMVVIKMVKGGVFGQNESEFAGDMVFDKRLGIGWDLTKNGNMFYFLGNESKNFARIKIAILELHQLFDAIDVI